MSITKSTSWNNHDVVLLEFLGRDIITGRCMAVLEIKDLFCALIGCMSRKTHAPGSISMCSFLYKHIENLEKACTRWVHRFQNMCTQPPKRAHRVEGAPLISNTEWVCLGKTMLHKRWKSVYSDKSQPMTLLNGMVTENPTTNTSLGKVLHCAHNLIQTPAKTTSRKLLK